MILHGNKMNLRNNKGSTVTSKKIPKISVKASNQEVILVNLDIKVDNEDNVELKNYKYILYTNNGEVKKSGNLTIDDKKLTFDDLDPQNVYTIKLYADYDLGDGKGELTNQEICSASFTTLSLNKLGNIKLNLKYDEKDLTYNSIKFNLSINTEKTDRRLLQILKNIIIKIKEEKSNETKEIEIEDISQLEIQEGQDILFENLKSNTKYEIDISARAGQGTMEEVVYTTYTLNSFKTNKSPVKMNVSNVIVTTNLIDLDIYIDDINEACMEKIVTVRLIDESGRQYIPKIEPQTVKDNTKIPINEWVRLTFNGLNEDTSYNLKCETLSYNLTDDNSKVINNYIIDEKQFVTTGLGGSLDLFGLTRIKTNSKNLIDIESENNWYSKCFDAITSSYARDDMNNAFLDIKPKYNYEKTYSDGVLSLLSNQCYVYDFSDYIGQQVTISFNGRITDNSAKVYLQKGKNIGKNIENITTLQKDSWVSYQKSVIIPDDGYLGFYLEESTSDYKLEIKNLQVELGEQATAYTPFSYSLFAKVNTNFIDKMHTTYNTNDNNCKYYIRITTNKGQTTEFDYIYEGTENVENLYDYSIEESNDEVEYNVELLIKQNSREYVLDRISFKYNPDDCKEIKSIFNLEEFKSIQPYGNYVLLNDIDLSNATTKGEFTFGNSKIPFYGSIDFNGKIITKDTYSVKSRKEVTSYLFYKLADSSNIKNAVIDYHINNSVDRFTVKVDGMDEYVAEEDGIYSLFLYNSGKIDNVIVNLTECSKKQRINVGLLGYKNSGLIDNFIVKYSTKLYGSKNMAGLCLYSDGVIQNGYIYGQGIEAIGNIAEEDYRNIAGVIFQLDGEGILQNLYNISGITINHCNATYSYACNIVYNLGYTPIINEQTGAIISQKESRAKIKDVYSTEAIITKFLTNTYYGGMDASNKEVYNGPNIINTYTNTSVDGSRYFYDLVYDYTTYNTKSPSSLLYEASAQELMLNVNGYKNFIVAEQVNNGYYPHLNLNYCMPKQENIRIDLTGLKIIDLISAVAIENNDISKLELSEKVNTEITNFINNNNVNLNDENTKIAEFRIYNPAGITITDLNINFLNTRIMSQTYAQRITTIYAILDNPSTFVNEYEVNSIKGITANGITRESIYGENEDLGTRTINISFIKYISNAEQWSKIDEDDENGVSGLIQNYRIVKDIDFSSSVESPHIAGLFEGYIDGQYNGTIHTLKNISGNESLIQSIDDATIKNLNIEGFKITNELQYVGMIERANISKNIVIDNIHIKGMEITSNYDGATPYIGGIVGFIDSNTTSEANKIIVQNCGVSGMYVEFNNKSVTTICVGGIIGYVHAFGGVDVYINNNYTQGIDFNTDVTSTQGVGGIVGYKTHNVDESIKLGTPKFYIKNCYTTGKINAKIRAGGILGYGLYGNTYVEKCYSLVNINSKSTSGAVELGRNCWI